MTEVPPDGPDPHWVRWHSAYADPDSNLSRRLAVVQGELRSALDAVPSGPIRLVSLCAGQGHDVLGVLEDHPRAAEVTARLVEMDEANAAAARERIDVLGLGNVEVVCGDAGTTDAVDGAVPADVVLACGIFGNISDADIESTVRALPSLCAPGATVLWTRHRAEPDLTPTIRAWFAEAGFDEVAFHGPPDAMFGVGSNRLRVPPPAFRPGLRLFEFLQ